SMCLLSGQPTRSGPAGVTVSVIVALIALCVLLLWLKYRYTGFYSTNETKELSGPMLYLEIVFIALVSGFEQNIDQNETEYRNEGVLLETACLLLAPVRRAVKRVQWQTMT
uniref:Uncharacterized protein n=1 Tax=Periophthalmus magnuspinnatus TaxID=409849 RepID=A0A3B4A2G2_9GOBI